MPTTKWSEIKHKSSPERREQIKREALAQLDRGGFAALRKARERTQVEIAEKLGIDQASVSALEKRSDLLLSTLSKYVAALGGRVEIVAVFPEASFNLTDIAGMSEASTPPVLNPKKRGPAKSAAAPKSSSLPSARKRA